MLVFRRGTWHTVDLPFSDPMLTKGHLAAAAAVVANQMVKGVSVNIAEAEKIMYDSMLGISREQHNGPQNKEK
jgi:hypothetical protein